MTIDRARSAANEIVKDMSGRGGGDHWWDSVDHDIQEEIIEAWAKIIMEAA